MGHVAVAVGKLKGDEDPTTKKIAQKVSQTLRKDKVAEELDGYVKNLSWYLDSLTVCAGSCKPFRNIMLTITLGFHEFVGVYRSRCEL